MVNIHYVHLQPFKLNTAGKQMQGMKFAHWNTSKCGIWAHKKLSGTQQLMVHAKS